MAVVINELEVAPPAAAEASGRQEAQAQGAGTASPEALKAVQRMLHTKQQRGHRLEAY